MAILGIDEVGRGPLAGPLVMGAVILPDEKPDWVQDLKDSKKLSAKKREKLSEIILKEAPATGLGWVEPAELDEIGISEALKLATKRAVKEAQTCHVAFSQIVIDGKVNFLKGTKLEKYVSTMAKADDLVKEVSAASIIAKVARDDYMIKLAEKYPEYGFESHVGYGAAKHLAAIKEFGICKEHRKSFEPIKSMIGFERKNQNVVKNTTDIGNKAEEKVAGYLADNKHKIIARNYKTKVCEIDIISTLDNKIYFTEVKYRKNNDYGGGLAAITPAKQKQMEFATEVFLKANPKLTSLQPLLSVAEVVGDDFELKDWFPLV
ncbi:ribonuclease HII [Candidatus Saccharibacteria bacterium]|nr:ribonuclease HII [Candidatus Saccharibacteria bacterium]